ncbi:cytochrome c family protein [Novosphingobium sp. Gsoil 351]|uniref:c-type cytochrome n=1 Tax=Novosphingobium sp. Gsoil 351 TaxID=2675225 RepID=UPI0012B451E8|nr:cytochrome c family protein [Novosphingobium sp. Gsoil 351]QGN54603.1 c-type cytochrome [Novosphingobium sp. Gsoil 351]
MRIPFSVISVISASLLLASCGGNKAEDGSEAADEAAAAAADTPAATTAAPAGAPAAAASAAPAADNTDTVDGVKLASLTGNAANGEKIFLQCKTCHTLEAGKNMIGPSLHGIIGRHSGEIAGFSYSAANKNSGITWSPDKLFQYLEKPQRVVPGTKMAFAGLSKAQDRADVIAYLTTASK